MKQAAFFDVDGTLLNINSMLDFIEFFFQHYYGEVKGLEKSLDYRQKRERLGSKAKREDLNHLYYLNFAGVDVKTLAAIGKKWFKAHVLEHPEVMNGKVLALLRWHQQQGHQVVFVSGGFFGTLGALAAYLGVEDVLCIQPTETAGCLTGEIDGIQTIGAGKAEAMSHYFDGKISWQRSYAYGDHISDAPMLALTGNPVAVGGNAEWQTYAKQNHWKQIKGISHG